MLKEAASENKWAINTEPQISPGLRGLLICVCGLFQPLHSIPRKAKPSLTLFFYARIGLTAAGRTYRLEVAPGHAIEL